MNRDQRRDAKKQRRARRKSAEARPARNHHEVEAALPKGPPPTFAPAE